MTTVDVWTYDDSVKAAFRLELRDVDLSSAVTPFDFGAAGDGTTDDTAAMAAFAGAVRDSSAVGRIPVGTFLVDDWTVYDGTTIVGDDPDGSVVKIAPRDLTVDTQNSAVKVKGTQAAPYTSVFLARFTLDGNRGGHVMPPQFQVSRLDLLDAGWLDGAVFTGLTLRDGPSDGIDLDNSTNCVVAGCRSYGHAGYGIHVSTESHGNRIMYCTVERNGHFHNRGGIDQYRTSYNNRYEGNVARDNYRNFNVDGSGAEFVGNVSAGVTVKPDRTVGVG